MECSEVRGFNYSGSWGTSGLDLWQHHDNGTMAVEIARGKEHFPGWNLCRWWLSEASFQRDRRRFLSNLDAGLSIFSKHDILVLPVVFNRWRDPICDFGGVSLEHIVPELEYGVPDLFAYVEDPWPRDPAPIERTHRAYLEAIIGAHREDRRVFAWDLCNEPLHGAYTDSSENPILTAELRWLDWCYRMCKIIGATQPLTIGNLPGKQALELTAELSDLFSTHPYYIWNAPRVDRASYESSLDDMVEYAASMEKELLATETVWGAVDDERRVDVMRYTLEELQKRRIGFVVHALQHSLVADLHYPEYGPTGIPGAMHFVNPDGSLRKGHGAFNEFS